MTWSLLADFDRDNVYEFDLTSYIDRPSHNLRISRGIGRDGKPRASKLTVSLTNRDGTFTPENSASSLFGQLTPGVPIQLTATHLATPYTIATGYAMTFTVSWASGTDPVCQVEVVDLFWFLQNGDLINTTASTSRDTDGALIAIMDAMGLTAADRTFDDGVQDLGMHFAVGQNPMEAMVNVVASEMGGLLYPAADGKIRFEARNSRLGTAVDATWGDGTSIVPQAIAYNLNPQEFYTSVSARSTVFRTGQDNVEVWRLSRGADSGDSIQLLAGAIYERDFNTESATVTTYAPVAGTDYRANSTIDGTGTDVTSSLEVTVTSLGAGKFRIRYRNTSGATIYVAFSRVTGQPVEFYADRAEAVFSLSVPNLKAGLSLQLDVPFAGDTGQKIRDYAYQELRVGRYPWPTIVLSFRALFDTEIAALLNADIGDLVRFTDLTGAINESSRVDDWWYIEGLEYSLPGDWWGETFDVSVTLIPSYVYRNLDAIAFDTFDRANAVGGLGTSFSDDVWANSTGFDVNAFTARPNSTALQVPNVAVS